MWSHVKPMTIAVLMICASLGGASSSAEAEPPQKTKTTTSVSKRALAMLSRPEHLDGRTPVDTYVITDPSDLPDTNLDDGIFFHPTLRAAIENANYSGGLTEIRFAASASVISKTTNFFPNISAPVIIDGQIDGSTNVVLDGLGTPNVSRLVFSSGGHEIRNIEFRNFTNSALALLHNNSNTSVVEGCTFHGNKWGLNMNYSKANVIGGADPAERNYFYENEEGGILELGAVTLCTNGLGGLLGKPREDSAQGISAAFPQSETLDFAIGDESEIRGAAITDNAGPGIMWNLDGPLVVEGSIVSGNTDFGIANGGAGSVAAEGNWWGAIDEPSGEGTGSGDPISSGVQVSEWLDEVPALTASFGADTLFFTLGTVDTIMVAVRDWSGSTATVDIDLSDSQGWLSSPASATVALTGSDPGLVEVVLSIPPGAGDLTGSSLTAACESVSDPNRADTAVTLVMAYQPTLAAIHVVPDSVTIDPGAIVAFFAEGIDQVGGVMAFTPTWSATGGTISEDGIYEAGPTLGEFTVSAEDSSGSLQATAHVTIDQITGVISEEGTLPIEFSLRQNTPNPFNPSTRIHFRLAKASRVTLEVFNVRGQLVETVLDRQLPAGNYSTVWEAAENPSGVYFYRLQAGEFTDSRKMLLLK